MPQKTKAREKRRSEQNQAFEQPAACDAQPRHPWQPCIHSFPSDEPTVRVFIHGLFGICSNNRGFCEIGVNNRTPDHDLRLAVFERDVGLLYSIEIGRPQNVPEQFIDITANRPFNSGVYFYQTVQPFNRQNHSDPKDFRWMPDLEDSREFYGQRLVKRANSFGPRIRIDSGVFHTFCKTESTFNIAERIGHSPASPPTASGSVATVTAADIRLRQSEYVSIKIGRQELRLHNVQDRKYDVLLYYTCTDPLDDDSAESPGDFHLHFDTFNLPANRGRFELDLEDEGTNPACLDTLSFLRLTVVSDPAPCGAVGYSKSNNLDE